MEPLGTVAMAWMFPVQAPVPWQLAEQIGTERLPWGADAPGGVTALCAEGVGACLFACTAALAARALVLIGSAKPAGISSVNEATSTGAKMRRKLVTGLLVANVVRCLALVAELCAQEGAGPSFLQELSLDQLQWLWDLITLLPAVVFLSTFSVVVLFWAQLHYTTTITPLQLLDCLFVCLNIACYVLVVAIAVTTFLLGAYTHLRIYMLCIIGFLNLVVALSFFYYGLMVVLGLKDIARKKSPNKRLVLRVIVLLVVCPVALVSRSGCYLAWGTGMANPGGRSRLWILDLVLCLIGEWFPTVVALAVLQPLLPSNESKVPSPSESLDDSTDSEAPLLQDAAPSPTLNLASGAANWKQLYPQPAANSGALS